MSTFMGRTPTDLVHMLAPAYGTGTPELPGMAWGGYRITYYTQAGDTLCPDCATKELLDVLADTHGYWHDCPVICESADMYNDDCDLTCDNCHVTLAEGYVDV